MKLKKRMKTYMMAGVGFMAMAAGIFGLTLEIQTRFHYFGTGTVFGIGIALLALTLIKWIKNS